MGFSLRTMLVVFVLLGGVIGWLGREVSIVRHEELALQTVRMIDGEVQVYFDFQNRDPEDDVEFQKDSPIPVWIKKVLGDRVFTRVESLSFYMSASDGDVDLRAMRNLGALTIYRVGCSGTSLRSLFDARSAPTLTQLHVPQNIRSASILEFNLEGIERLDNVESLDIWNGRIGFQSIKDLEFLPRNTNLRELYIINCRRLASLNGIERAPNLEKLMLSGKIENLIQLHSMERLRELDISSCEISNLDVLNQLPALSNLTISLDGIDSSRLNSSFLSNLDKLQELTIYSGENLKDLSAISTFGQLKSLAIDDCKSLEGFVDLDSLVGLTRLNLKGCEMLTSVDGLQNLEKLEDVTVADCQLLKSLKPMGNLGQLKRLDFDGCVSIKTLEGLGKLKVLSELRLDGCESLEDIAAILELPALEHVNLVGCDNIPKQQIEKLKRVCPNVKTETSRGWF